MMIQIKKTLEEAIHVPITWRNPTSRSPAYPTFFNLPLLARTGEQGSPNQPMVGIPYHCRHTLSMIILLRSIPLRGLMREGKMIKYIEQLCKIFADLVLGDDMPRSQAHCRCYFSPAIILRWLRSFNILILQKIIIIFRVRLRLFIRKSW